ncbi:conserved hypothetical protein [Sphingomonas aurantiaca]|uniref:Uncharacterized protein n=1 Tax=Sphingomonas aurantiaca TaxID=185949 RepID=A0A2T5GJT5_9SPHN|nr:hypothetical protein [Sphingomonas aurantiaca]PTQ59583.1 hypothetical protein C8J26_2431 [Sphingomonas aurantiaca]VVT10738.1 conserved hypothetical protein [Sphingomonas aurantiaca]
MTTPPFPRERGGPGISKANTRDPGLLRAQENIWPARAAEMAAIFMVGDGLIGLLQPRRHVDLWKDDALGTEKLVSPFVDRPGRRRLYAVVQIAAGLALAARQRP